MAAPLWLTWPHWKHQLTMIQRLDLRLLVHTEHQGVFGWGKIQPHHIAHLGNKIRIGGELERLLPMRIQPEGAPNPLHRADRKAALPRHAARTGVGALGRSWDGRMLPLWF